MLSNCGWSKTLESPLDCKEIKSVHPKRNQPWIFTGSSDAEAEALKHGPSDANSWLIRKDPDAGKDWRQEKGTTEDETVGWHHWLNGHESEQTPGDGEGQGSLAHCSLWDPGMKPVSVVHGITKSQTWLRNWTTTPTKMWTHLHQKRLGRRCLKLKISKALSLS